MEFGVSLTKKGIAYPWIGGGTGNPFVIWGPKHAPYKKHGVPRIPE